MAFFEIILTRMSLLSTSQALIELTTNDFHPLASAKFAEKPKKIMASALSK
jgi:hypothetical protein